MLKKIALAVFSALLFQLPAGAAPRAAKAQYLGAITINAAQDAAVLADWYAKFGVDLHAPQGGYYWGTFNTAGGQFLFGIHPKKANGPKKSSSSVSVTFRIDDYDGIVATLQGRGLVAESTEADSSGRFAHYRDPDGNEMTVWGN